MMHCPKQFGIPEEKNFGQAEMMTCPYSSYISYGSIHSISFGFLFGIDPM
jgi:hypothetical protein